MSKVTEKTARSTYGAANPQIRQGAAGGTTGVGQKRGPLGGYPNPTIPEFQPDEDDFRRKNFEGKELEHEGLFLALKIPDETGEALLLPDGEPLEKLHVTLVYSKAGSTEQRRQALAIAREMFGEHAPVAVKLGGMGRFSASESSEGKDVLYVSVDSPGLTALRGQLVDRLKEIGIESDTSHGYSPHVTIKYLDPGAPLPVRRFDPIEVTLSELVHGGVEKTQGIDLVGPEAVESGLVKLIDQELAALLQVKDLVRRGGKDDLFAEGSERVDDAQIEKVLKTYAKLLAKNGLAPGEELGRGSNGAAFVTAKNTVLKITKDYTEATAANLIKGKKMVHVVRVTDVFRLPEIPKLKEPWFGIVQEKLTPLSKREEFYFDKAMNQMDSAIGNTSILKITWKEIAQYMVKEPSDEKAARQAVATLNEMQFPQMLDELRRLKIDFSDFHSGNIMKRGDDFVVIDLGFSKNPGHDPRTLESVVREVFAKILEGPTSLPVQQSKDVKGPKSTSIPTTYIPSKTGDQPIAKNRGVDATSGKKVIDQYRELMASKRKLQVAPNPTALGTGQYGTAFDIGQGKVLKVTSDLDEAKAALKMKGVNSKHVVKVYDVFEFQNSEIYGVVEEKLQEVPENDKADLDEALEKIKIEKFLQAAKFDWDATKKLAIKYMSYQIDMAKGDKKKQDWITNTFAEGWHVLESKFQVGEMAKELKANGVDFFDYHSGNIMRRPGAGYVIVDLGHYSKTENEKTPDVLETVVNSIREAGETTTRSGASPKSNWARSFVKVLEFNAEGLRKKGIDPAKLHALGQGEDGVAYDVGGDKVLKVTVDEKEAVADMLLKGKKLDHVVQIFDVFSFKMPKAGGKQLFGIIEEKLTALSAKEKLEFESATDFFNPEVTPKAKEFRNALRSGNWEQFEVVLKRVLEDDIAGEREDEPDGEDKREKLAYLLSRKFEIYVQILKKFKLPEMMKELKEAGIQFTDYHGGNIMKRGTNYVINDMGRSGVKEGGPVPVLERAVLSVLDTISEGPNGATGGSMYGTPGSSQTGVKAQSSAWSAPSGMVKRKDPNDPDADEDDDEGLWQNQMLGNSNMQKMTYGHAEEIDPDEKPL